MKCDHCDNEATVHEVTVKSGVKIEKHLCEGCASTQGISGQPSTPINELIKHYVMSHGMPAAAAQAASSAGKAQSCPTCKTTFSEFRQHGLLGCPDCYKVFEPQLGPLLERAHDGGVTHKGKAPRRMFGSGTKAETRASIVNLEERAERLRKMRKELATAVKAEQYELAAKLRDQLRQMDDPGLAGPATLS